MYLVAFLLLIQNGTKFKTLLNLNKESSDIYQNQRFLGKLPSLQHTPYNEHEKRCVNVDI